MKNSGTHEASPWNPPPYGMSYEERAHQNPTPHAGNIHKKHALQEYGTTHLQGFSPACPDVVVFNPGSSRTRVAQACENCRFKKQKCDGGTPCASCEDHGLVCQYRIPAHTTTQTKMDRLIRYLDAHHQAFDRFAGSIDSFNHRLQHLEEQRHSSFLAETPTGFASTDLPPQIREPQPGEHRTAPHTLIRLWPSVTKLLHDARVSLDENYVAEAEERAALRIDAQLDAIEERNSGKVNDPPNLVRGYQTGSVIAGAYEPTVYIRFSNTAMERGLQSGLKSNASLDLEATTVMRLLESYLKHIHRMHPFLDIGTLKGLIDSFVNKNSPRNLATMELTLDDDGTQRRPTKRRCLDISTAPGSLGRGHPLHRARYLDRNPETAIVLLVLALGKICLHRGPLPGAFSDDASGPDTTAIHQLSGSDVTVDSGPPLSIKEMDSCSPASLQSPARECSCSDRACAKDSPRGRSSTDSCHEERNLDLIPGLAYYAQAAEMLGYLCDGNDLVHAQLFLLAGLYKGQLARVKESMRWINMASQVIMALLERHKLYNHNYRPLSGDMSFQYREGQSRIRNKQHNFIVLASWTCLQLQSDILADLRLPSSGIQTIENLLLMPLAMPGEDAAEKLVSVETGQLKGTDVPLGEQVLIYYTSQAFLRKRLNRIQREIYGDEFLQRSLRDVCEMLSGHEKTLKEWRSTLPYALQWVDTDLPPSDILDARLRAKYWGACYIVNRPFLDYLLHIIVLRRQRKSIRSIAMDAHGCSREEAEIHLFEAIATMSEDTIWRGARRCIDAAMNSTVAFDGVPDRLIVTNIHGTAHA